MSSLWPYVDPRWHTLEKWLAAAFVALFAYCVCAWQGLLGFQPGWHPLQSVFLSGAIVLQAMAALVQRQSRALWLLLLLTSLVILGYSVAAL
jgi:hypothetical protein